MLHVSLLTFHLFRRQTTRLMDSMTARLCKGSLVLLVIQAPVQEPGQSAHLWPVLTVTGQDSRGQHTAQDKKVCNFNNYIVCSKPPAYSHAYMSIFSSNALRRWRPRVARISRERVVKILNFAITGKIEHYLSQMSH